MSEEQNEVMELDTNVESIEEEVTLEEMPEKETVDSFELTLEELDSLSNESKKVKADETHQKVVRFINQKKIATITKNIKGKDVYQFSSSSGTLLVAKFNSAAAQNVAITEAAPNMSYFISSMLAPGFNEIPPVSKVMPLPTNT